MSIMQIRNLTKKFGGLTAVNNVSFDVHDKEILSVIGPNGAGKSTLFKLISSFLNATSGNVIFKGEDITSEKPHVVAKKGVIRTFQETTIFRDMTVLENVVVAHHLKSRASLWGFFFNTKLARNDEKKFQASAYEILEYLGIASVRNEIAKNLPHGHLRALGIAMGMAANPKILLLDEPFAGMNSEETAAALKMVQGIREKGITVLLVEHDVPSVMKISDRIVVLNFGEKIAEGVPADIQNNETVIEAYLGKEDEEIGI